LHRRRSITIGCAYKNYENEKQKKLCQQDIKYQIKKNKNYTIKMLEYSNKYITFAQWK